MCYKEAAVFDRHDGECAFICVYFHTFSSASAGVLLIKSSSLRVLDVHAIMDGVIGNCSRFVCQWLPEKSWDCSTDH